MSDSLGPHRHQAHPSMGFSRQEYWSGLPFPSPENFLTQGSNPGLLHCRQMLYHLSYQGSSQLYGGINGNLLQEGLYHTQIYCTQSCCPCSSPLLTHTSSGNTQTLFCLSLCGVSGSWCSQGLFEPSERLWQHMHAQK